jgi:predicted kinase
MGALLIIVTGPSATGKTGIAKRLAADLHLPTFHKDAIKEQLFNSLGWSDRAWSRKLGGASYDLIWQFAEALLTVDCSAIIEGNFRGTVAETHLRTIAAHTRCRFVQVHCWAESKVLLERYRERVKSGDRHPGHLDDPNDPTLREQLADGRYEPLDIEGDVIDLDMTDRDAIEYDKLVKRLRGLLKEA